MILSVNDWVEIIPDNLKEDNKRVQVYIAGPDWIKYKDENDNLIVVPFSRVRRIPLGKKFLKLNNIKADEQWESGFNIKVGEEEDTHLYLLNAERNDWRVHYCDCIPLHFVSDLQQLMRIGGDEVVANNFIVE